MKKIIIATLVAAIIVFIYQALSWTVLPIHKNAIKYSENQDEIIEVLSSNLNENGMYGIPMHRPDASSEEVEKYMKDMEGNPFAVVTYYKEYHSYMGMTMVRGFIFNFCYLLIMVLIIYHGKNTFGTFGKRFWLTCGLYLMAFIQITLMEWNWWQTPWHFLSGIVIDLIITAILIGLWFGWYLKPKEG